MNARCFKVTSLCTVAYFLYFLLCWSCHVLYWGPKIAVSLSSCELCNQEVRWWGVVLELSPQNKKVPSSIPEQTLRVVPVSQIVHSHSEAQVSFCFVCVSMFIAAGFRGKHFLTMLCHCMGGIIRLWLNGPILWSTQKYSPFSGIKCIHHNII